MYGIPYFIVFIIFLSLCIPIVQTNNCGQIQLRHSSNMLKYVVLLIVFLFFYGLRQHVLTDWFEYENTFDFLPSLFSKDFINSYNFVKAYTGNVEKGFVLFTILCKTICSSFYFFQFINTLIDFCLLTVFFKKYLNNRFYWGFLCFFIFYGNLFEINLMRNIKALLLFLFSIKYIERKRFVKFLLLNICGALFHSSSFLLIPLYFILDKKINRKIILSLFIIGNLFFIFHISLFTTLLNSLITHFSEGVGRKFTAYLLDDSSKRGFSPSYVERIITFCFFFACSKKFNLYDNSKLRIIINSFYIYVLIPLFFDYTIFYERVMPLFAYSYWILYPICYFNLSKNKKQIFLLLFIIYGSYASIHSNNNIIAKYNNIIFKEEDRNERIREIYHYWGRL